MSSQPRGKDLVVLVADKNMEAAVEALLARPGALQIKPLTFRVHRHPHHDPGCRSKPHAVLTRQLADSFRYALVLFDREGSGGESLLVTELEARVVTHLGTVGWTERAAAVAIDPELEIWIWSDSPHVAAGLGWQGRKPTLRDWLRLQGTWKIGEAKPRKPKEAVESALREVQKIRSSARYRQIAQRVNLGACSDASFARFRSCLQAWFPAQG